MRTLDEVIKGLSNYPDLENEDIVQVNADIIVDALHYLKDYQRYQNTPSRIMHMALCDAENDPLTWEELKGMEGKPVWVKRTGKIGHWDIVRRTGRIYEGEDPDMWMWFYVGDKKQKTMYGKTWQAYRKEQK